MRLGSIASALDAEPSLVLARRPPELASSILDSHLQHLNLSRGGVGLLYIGGMVALVSLCELTTNVTMHLLLRCFIATWVSVALLQGTRAFAFKPTAAITAFNEGIQLPTYPEPTPLSHSFHDAH